MNLKKIVKRSKSIRFIINNFKKIFFQNRTYNQFLTREASEFLTKDELKEKLLAYDIITFDIFDTLITRKVYEPDDLFKIMDNELKNVTTMNLDFCDLRKRAEQHAISQRRNKTNIHDIYEAFAKLVNLSKDQVEWIKNFEIELELKICIPRRDIQQIFNELTTAGKKIILLSDMYLTQGIVEKILEKCGYVGYHEIWISCEMGCRKSNGSMWKIFFNQYGNLATLHIGDNKHSDIMNVSKESKQSLYLMDGKQMFCLTDFAQNLATSANLKIGDSFILGVMANKIFCNSPFAFKNKKAQISVNNLYDLGYAVYGPIFLYFFVWLNEQFIKNRPDILLFFSRDGYFLKKMYDSFNEMTDYYFPKIDTHYFYASRRSTSVPNLETVQDIENLLDTGYYGKFSALLKSRYGIDILPGSDDPVIKLPKKKHFVCSLLVPYINIILEKAKYEKENYLKYIESINEHYKQKNIAIVDLGSSGTAHYYLSKMINKKIDGYYFTLSNNVKPQKIGCNAFSCFGQETKEDGSDKFWTLVEAFLTAPHGQHSYFEGNDKLVKPIFVNRIISESKICQLQEVYKGINDFFKDSVEIFDKNLSADLYSVKLIRSILGSIYNTENTISTNLSEFFTLECQYNNDREDDLKLFL